MSQIAVKPAWPKRKWTPEELEYLRDNYGLVPVKKLAKRLKRSENVIRRIARTLGLHVTDNFYTGSELTRSLGLNKNIGRIVRWVGKGWLEGTKAPAASGRFALWCFTEEAVVDCLRRRPWLVDLESMPAHYFRSIVREEREKDPWYTSEQATPLLGFKSRTIIKYIHCGWLLAEKARLCGGRGKWIMRRSAIKTFLKNAPNLRREHRSSSMQESLISLGRPTRVAITWAIRCLHCGDRVKLVSSPTLSGPQVHALFLKEHTNGHCIHGSEVLIPYPTLTGPRANK